MAPRTTTPQSPPAPAGAPMQRRPVSAIWDDRLAPAMRRHCRKVEAEHVIADLLADLSS